ncbi:MAG: excinuclease subunit UvrB, partial [Bacteroidota bacterium]
FIPATNTYIEKDLSINQEIEKLRLRATSALLSGRKDVIIVSSVSAIYGMGRPEDFKANIWSFKEGEKISLNAFLNKLVDLFYSRTTAEFKRGNFRVKGDTVDVFPAYDDYGLRVMFFGDEVEKIQIFDPESGRKQESLTAYTIFPANLFVTPKDALQTAIKQIQAELMDRVNYFKSVGMFIEAQRLLERTEFDLEMMRELGYCSGIENYSRYLSFRDAGSRPYCLLDYFPEDYLMVLDESHVTIPQIRGMSGGDKSRKMVLVEHGFRLPSAMDNRPQQFAEFDSMINQVIYVSATPSDFELQAAGGVVVEQIVRPTGLLDPEVEVRPLINQVDDLLEEIDERTKRGERVLVTTLTKRMAEEMARYLADLKIKCRYIHSEVESLERVDILHDLRSGKIDVLVGVNLLREGLDLPEVTLVAILDADKEGFLRSAQALIQTAGRAARNVDGRVILYADKITPAMKQLMDETTRRRRIQMDYNEKHGITPQTIQRENIDVFGSALGRRLKGEAEPEPENTWSVAEGEAEYLTVPVIEERIKILRKDMEAAAKELNFVEAARLRDELFAYQARLKENKH